MPIIAKEDTRVAEHLSAIRAILDTDVFPAEMGAMLRDYCRSQLNHDEDLFIEVFDRLASDKIISKVKFRELWNYQE
jgi:hypothetical protein